MAQSTLYEALYAFNERYLDALSSKSLRQIAIIEQQWQQINNYWDLYLQAKAEGNTTGANNAIDGIVNLLGAGTVDISILPNIGGVITERDGVLSVLPVAQKISFADLGTTNYRLIFNITDANGYPIAYVLGTLETDGFNITPSFSGTLSYNAKIIS